MSDIRGLVLRDADDRFYFLTESMLEGSRIDAGKLRDVEGDVSGYARAGQLEVVGWKLLAEPQPGGAPHGGSHGAR